MKYLAAFTACNLKIQKQLAPGNTLGGVGGYLTLPHRQRLLFHRDPAIAADFRPRKKEGKKGFGSGPPVARKSCCTSYKATLDETAQKKKPDVGVRASSRARKEQSQRTPKVKTVSECTVSPGFSRVGGKPGWLGESGKCCVSRQKPKCFWYFTPVLPVYVPSRKLPE